MVEGGWNVLVTYGRRVDLEGASDTGVGNLEAVLLAGTGSQVLKYGCL